MNKPTSEAWFEPWKTHLVKQGLILMNDTELIELEYADRLITSCIISDGMHIRHIKADNYVMCIDPFNSVDIFNKSDMHDLRNRHRALTKDTDSRQIAFRLGFDKQIKFPDPNMAFIMVDSEFNITLYPQETHWNKNVKLDNNNHIKSLWSGTIIQSYGVSSMYGKTALKLTKDELIIDIIDQILRSDNFQKLIYDENGFNLTKEDISYTEIWYEWYMSPTSGELEQSNKKWVNNIYNEEFRPTQKTNYPNLYLGGAHTQTTTNIWSMESAVESGKIVAGLIAGKSKENDVVRFEHLDPFYIRFFQIIDDMAYAIYMPNIIDITILIITVLVMMHVIKMIYK
jgi:hypothetical protein